MANSSTSTPAPVPPLDEVTRKPRMLILCFDGTTDQYDAANTNVVKLYSLLKKDKVGDQLCYYQAGIGTYIQPGTITPLFQWAGRILDEAIAWYLYQHVMDGYKFLMQNYDVGDKVCLFGFSRGAYTARALAGMLHKVGLLSKDNIEQIPFAYQLYTSTKPEDITLAEGFKATFSRQVPIDFLGVWDTVASVGVIMGKSLPFVDVNTTIRVFRHALSLDEHRTKFRPNLYHRSNARQAVTKGRGIRHLFQRNKAKVVTEPTVGNIQGGEDELYEADAKEVWFVGCHADVGGGVAPDTAPHALANIPLRWMIQEIVLAECSILFDFDAFARWNLPITLGQHYPPLSVDAADKSGNGTETSPPDSDQQDAQDVVQPITDQLTKIPAWWLLEIIPTSFTYQNSENKWVTRWSFHLGRGRWVPKNPLFHKSVKTRMDDSTLKYKPRAQYTKGTETYVS